MRINQIIKTSRYFFAFFLITLSAHADILPDIEARRFDSTPIEKSHSGRVYRFSVKAQDLPHTGSIVLINEHDKPVMAFRVMKADEAKSEFIAKRVRRYDTVSELVLKQRYTSAEKLAELVTPPALPKAPAPKPVTATPLPDSAAQLGSQIAKPYSNPNAKPELGASYAPTPTPVPAVPELDPLPGVPLSSASNVDPNPTSTKTPEVEQYDQGLDSSTTPHSDDQSDEDDEDDDSLTTAASDLEVDETVRLNPFKNMLGVSLGSFRNMSNFNISKPSINNGFSVYYSHQIDRSVLVHGKKPQDSLSLEYGLSYYNRVNADAPYDEYTVMPLRIELRYDLHLSESFALLAFGGLQYNVVLSNLNVSATKNETGNLQGPGPDVGIGFLYNLGPQWYLRGDLGLDRYAIGLAVKW